MGNGKKVITVVVFFISMILVSLMFIQFRTVETTNSMGLEIMREEELRQEIIAWKTKQEEIEQKLVSNKEKIEEYKNIIQNNQQSSELLEAELKEYEMLIGKTRVTGDGVIITLTDNSIMYYKALNLLYLVNTLKDASAEAISINGHRIVNNSEIVYINNKYILVNGERISSPYVVKAIGDQEKLVNELNFSDVGYIQDYKQRGYTIEMKEESNIIIEAYNGEILLEHLKEEE